MNEQNEDPLVSVLVTSYNREKYICATIDSILNQKFQSFEIVVCDNCSTDHTMEVLEKYTAHSKIRIYQNEENIGQFPNRNRVARYAKGKYLKYVDSDDLIYPTCLEIMVDAMEKFPEAGWGLYNDQDKLKPHPFLLTPQEAYEYHYLIMPVFDRSPLGAIIKRSAFETVGGFQDINMAGDFEMWHRLACDYSLVLFGSGLGWNRVHDSQEMNRYSFFVHQYYSVRAKYLTGSNNPLDNSVKRKLISAERKDVLRQAVRNGLKLKLRNSLELIKLYKSYRHYDELH